MIAAIHAKEDVKDVLAPVQGIALQHVEGRVPIIVQVANKVASNLVR